MDFFYDVTRDILGFFSLFPILPGAAKSSVVKKPKTPSLYCRETNTISWGRILKNYYMQFTINKNYAKFNFNF